MGLMMGKSGGAGARIVPGIRWREAGEACLAEHLAALRAELRITRDETERDELRQEIADHVRFMGRATRGARHG